MINQPLLQPRKRFTNADLAQKIDGLALLTAQQFTRQEERFDHLEIDINDMKHSLGSLQSNVGTLQNDVNTLKTDVGSLKTNVNTLKEDMASVKYKLYEHDQRFDSQDERLEKLEFHTQNMREDLKLVLPNHEFRIAKLEKYQKTAASHS